MRTLSFDPRSARNRAIIFMLRPLMAAKTMGNIVGPFSYQYSSTDSIGYSPDPWRTRRPCQSWNLW